MYAILSGSSWLLLRTPLTLLTFLSATVKVLRFKLAKKFLLDELTYLIFMIISEGSGILRTSLLPTGADFEVCSRSLFSLFSGSSVGLCGISAC